MSHPSRLSVPMYRNPTFRPGLAALVETLMQLSYSSHAIGRIFDYVACNGTLEGAPIDPEDMERAEAIFVDSLPALDYDNPCWGDEFDYVNVASLEGWAAIEGEGVPPIAGGAPEYEPTPADWADYREHFDRLDALERERAIEAFHRHRND